MDRIRVIPPNGDTFEQPLEGDEVTIGRASDCDLVIGDRFLSRRHARLRRVDDGWMVEDLGSRNGSILNGRRIDGSEALRPGDQLQLSGSILTLLGAEKVRPSSGTSEFGDHTIFRNASDLISQSELDDSTEGMGESTRRYTERLRMLHDVHQALGRSIELDQLLELILGRAFEHLMPEEGVIFLRDEGGEYYRAAMRSNRGGDNDYLYSETLVNEVAEKGLAALVLDVESDERFADAQSILASGVSSLVAAPLLDEEGSLGMIALSSRANKRQFSEEDMELLVSLASVAALRIRNVALAVEAAERQRLEDEMRVARQIQVALLPDKLPEIPGYALHGGNIPSRGASGDYYEVLERKDGHECVLMIADVSGKGIAASILTASIEALSAGPIEVGMPTDEICAAVSRRLFERTSSAKYATAFLAILEGDTGTVRYTNAGHNPGLVVRADGAIDRLLATGMPIGLMHESPYQAAETRLEPGDTLVLYTDGITEAEDPEDEEYGLERLEAVCRGVRNELPEAISDAIEKDLERFVRGVPFADDRTVVIVQRIAAT